MATLNLLGNTTRVETPYVKVTIGDYTFGVMNQMDTEIRQDVRGTYRLRYVKFPNFIQSLKVVKINGQVNKYTLNISYPITEKDDPNFFEKVFSSVKTSRKIYFTYGDMSAPSYIYKEEEAIIQSIQQSFSRESTVISYTINATSSAVLASQGSFSFPSTFDQPSKVIEKLLEDKRYGLTEVFPGMRDLKVVKTLGLLNGTDNSVYIEAKSNISVLDYLTYLVSCMTNSSNSLTKGSIYSMVIVDESENYYSDSGNFMTLGGSYFKIIRVSSGLDDPQTYSIDIGYPSQNIVTNFSIENNESYSLYYDFQQKINDYEYVHRINDNGEMEEVYCPVLSTNSQFQTTDSEMTWWSKVTSFPVGANIELKGLLRPAILMTHVRLNVYYYGKKHISSGLYIITGQTDEISTAGYKTTLGLRKIAGDDDYI